MTSSLVWKKGMAALLVLLMIPATAGISSAQASTTSQRPYDGETIFRGLILGDGPVAKLFPEIWQDPQVLAYRQRAEQQNSAEQIAAARQKLIHTLRGQDPTFLSRFGTEMQSGDPVRVEGALTELSSRFANELSKSVSSDGFYQYKDVALDEYVEVAAVLAVVLFVAAFIILEPGPGKGVNANSHLQRDALVRLITERLGPASAQ